MGTVHKAVEWNSEFPDKGWKLENIDSLLLVKFIKHNQNYYLKLDVSTAAGTQFFRFLTQWEDAVLRKQSHAWLSW